MRDVPGRLDWFLGHEPNGAARCAEHTWHALGGPKDPPRQNLPSATAVANRTMAEGHALNHGPAPRGAIHYWAGGSAGHGHVGIAADDAGTVASVDVGGPGTVGVRPLAWFKTWSSLRYLGWSWWWGAFNTEFEEAAMPVKPYIVRKVETDQVIPLNKWTMLDLGAVDKVQPPTGSNDWDTYLNLALGTLTGAGRNDLRYVLGRWARHDAGSPDAIKGGIDVTGADTKAIPPDLPRETIRFTWSHDFKGEVGVPVSFWVYIGAMRPGTIVSPLRIFKIDDETT